MVYIQAFKSGNKLANGRKGKEYYRHFVIIPKVLIDALGWKKGDELVFKLDGKRVFLRKTCTE